MMEYLWKIALSCWCFRTRKKTVYAYILTSSFILSVFFFFTNHEKNLILKKEVVSRNGTKHLGVSNTSVGVKVKLDSDGNISQSHMGYYTRSNCSVQNQWKAMTVPSKSEYLCEVESLCAKESVAGNGSCPCIPDNLHGKVQLNVSTLLSLKWSDLGRILDDNIRAGHWRPSHCGPRRKVAVIIPYRDRERHLRAFMAHYHPIFQRQLIEYQIFVIEQNHPYTFNKAALMNVGFLESQKLFQAETVLFIDVDTLAENDDNIVIAGEMPLHWAAFIDRFQYDFKPAVFGAAVVVTAKQFTDLNGFCTLYWGWGGEDDDFRNRVRKKFQGFLVPPKEVARFTLMNHTRDTLNLENPERQTVLTFVLKYTEKYGLGSIKYNIVNIVQKRFYTWISLNIKEPNRMRLLNGKTNKKFFLPAGIKTQTRKFVKHSGRCHGTITNGNSTISEAFYKSVVTCQYMCESQEGCRGVWYHESRDDTSYCHLLREGCEVITDYYTNADVMHSVYIIEEYESEFHLRVAK